MEPSIGELIDKASYCYVDLIQAYKDLRGEPTDEKIKRFVDAAFALCENDISSVFDDEPVTPDQSNVITGVDTAGDNAGEVAGDGTGDEGGDEDVVS